MLVGGPFGLGAPELLLILVIVVVIFGASRLADIGGALGKGIREFRRESRLEEGESAKAPPAPVSAATTGASSPAAPPTATCPNPECKAAVPSGAQFCPVCGTRIGAPTASAS